MSKRVTAPYGAWPSPLSADDVARGGRTPNFPSIAGNEVWWQESRPEEGGRVTVMRRAADGTATEVLPAPWRAQTLVHEYGGRSYLPVPTGDGTGIVFANFTDQRLYLLDPAEPEPRPLTPEAQLPRGLRYADMALGADHIICVREQHEPSASDGEEAPQEAPQVRRAIVAIPLSGAAATDPGAIRELAAGADFYAAPALAPDGAHLAWIQWNHPRMPWDGTELRVGAVAGVGPLRDIRMLKGGVGESVLAPHWRDSTTLYCLSDWPGWWNLYEVGLHGPAISLYPAEEEFTPPPWQLGISPYCVLDDGRIVTLHGHADMGVGIYDPRTGDLAPVETAFTTWRTLSTDGTTVVGIAGSPDTPASVVRLDPRDRNGITVLRSEGEAPDAAYLPAPRAEALTGRYGQTVYANVYPPANPGAEAEGPAPYVVWVHGGPTGVADTALHLDKAYFTSRGIGIIDVNYSGSAGHGRGYRQRLHHQWGIVDVEDAATAAQALVDQGIADPGRLAIRGGSSGGFTALLALTGDIFACGVSYFGVTDLMRLAKETHDFESRYLDSLVGPLPGYEATYAERSPMNRANEVDVPVLLLQGSEDTVVPPSQATEFAEVLAERGVLHAYLEFTGEAHGFRKAENRAQALEAELAFYGAVFGFEPPGVTPIELNTAPPKRPTAEANPH